MARLIELELSYEGYTVSKATDGRDGLAEALGCPFDLILLDIMLPGINGLQLLRRLRAESDVPVILLTARDETLDKVSGLDSGANDYITKPFAIEELLARIRAILRVRRQQQASTAPAAAAILSAGPLQLRPLSRECSLNQQSIDLTRREFDLLQCLLENKNRVMSREQLLETVWGYDFYGETNTVDVYIRYLRAKIEEPSGLKLIRTVRGIGYQLKDPDGCANDGQN